jgi:ribonuclease J
VQALRIVALGGLDEVGMNCLTLECDGKLIVVDCGLTFPDGELGVDVIHPDLGYLEARREAVSAVVLTHGHEDHVGAVPYLLAKHDVPVYGPAHALAVLERRLEEHNLSGKAELHEVEARERLRLGPFEVEPYRVAHSIPQATGLIMRTPFGIVIHSGDFRFDSEPLDGEPFDEAAVDEARAEGVRLLMSDSTNVTTATTTSNEASVAPALAEHVAAARARVIVCLFASNLYRVGAALSAAYLARRKVLWLGRSLLTHREIAERLGLLPELLPEFVSEHDAAKVPRHQLMVLATGSQGEERAALSRLARGQHPQLRLEPGDSVVLSSRVIPGNETSVFRLLDVLERAGIKTISRVDDPRLHASGHACRDDQRRLIELARPAAFMPLHGAHHQLRRHAELAASLGVEQTVIAHNGTPLELDHSTLRLLPERVATGRVHVQAGRAVSGAVLQERNQLSREGVVFVTVQLDTAGALAQPPAVQSAGLFSDEDEAKPTRELERRAAVALGGLTAPLTEASVEELLERTMRRYFREAYGLRPLVRVRVLRGAR